MITVGNSVTHHDIWRCYCDDLLVHLRDSLTLEVLHNLDETLLREMAWRIRPAIWIWLMLPGRTLIRHHKFKLRGRGSTIIMSSWIAILLLMMMVWWWCSSWGNSTRCAYAIIIGIWGYHDWRDVRLAHQSIVPIALVLGWFLLLCLWILRVYYFLLTHHWYHFILLLLNDPTTSTILNKTYCGLWSNYYSIIIITRLSCGCIIRVLVLCSQI